MSDEIIGPNALIRCELQMLVTGWFMVGATLAIVCWALDINRFFADYGASFMEHLLCSGSCMSGMAFGIAIVRGWVYDQAD
jgi:hypothetical protein